MVVYRISGAFFFGAAASIGTVLERIGDAHRNLIIDFSAVPFVDSTGAKTIEGLAHKAAQRGVGVTLTGMSEGVRRELAAQGARRPLVNKAAFDRSGACRDPEQGAGIGAAALAYGTSTPGFMIPAGSRALFAAANALPNRSGRCARYQGIWSRPTA